MNHGDKDYEAKSTSEAPDCGTEVVVLLHEDHGAYLDEKEIRTAIRAYADFIPFPIYLNGNGPVTSMNAPWHTGDASDSEAYHEALQNFILNRYPDRPLLIVPVNLRQPRAQGVLYISDQPIQRSINRATSRWAARIRSQQI